MSPLLPPIEPTGNALAVAVQFLKFETRILGFHEMFGLTNNRNPNPNGFRALVIVQQAFGQAVDVLDMQIHT